MLSTEKIAYPCTMKNDFSIELLIHSHNVAKVVLAMGKELKLSVKDFDLLQEAALYHDIGKSRVPEKILYKPGKLDPMEWELMKKHAADSEAIYLGKGKQSPRKILIGKIIRHHHENWDGSGYPDRIQREEIPFLSRILKIADVFDAMKQKRIYRREPIPNVLEVMEGLVGTELDPDLFYRCSRTLENF